MQGRKGEEISTRMPGYEGSMGTPAAAHVTGRSLAAAVFFLFLSQGPLPFPREECG
jgi:hypothetical protein